MNKYTEAIQGDDVVILCDGIPMGVGEILAALNAATPPADASLIGKLRHQLAQATDEAARLRALSQPGVAQVPEVTEAMLVAALKEADPLGALVDWDETKDCVTRPQMRRILEAALLSAAPSANGGAT